MRVSIDTRAIRPIRYGLLLVAALLLTGCAEEGEQADQQAAQRATRVTVAEARAQTVELTDRSVGQIRSKAAPMLTAEVGGRLTEVRVDTGVEVAQGDLLAAIDPQYYSIARDSAAAEVQRLNALIDNQQRQVRRFRELVKENFVTTSALEEAEAQLEALREQLSAARAGLEQAELDLSYAQVRAPVDGIIDERLVSAGDYVQRGQPLFRLVGNDLLSIALPFPETVASKLRPGLPVRLSTPLTPGQPVVGKIKEIRPAVLTGSRSLEAIVELPNPGGWRAGASVVGEVVIEQRDSVLVPENSAVRRPAGIVVYEIIDGVAHARQVSIGTRKQGQVEILDGLAADAVVAVDGASFLSDGAPVDVVEEL